MEGEKTMICRRCKKTAPDAPYCALCGFRQDTVKNTRKRGNGQGCVYKLNSGKYKAIVTLGWYHDADGGFHRRTRSKVFDKKKDAVAALPELRSPKTDDLPTFKTLFDKWFPTHQAGKSTLDCYRAAVKYLAPVYDMTLDQITVDDLQECIDDCGHGKRTQENIRAVIGLVYKYGIPRKAVPDNLNLAPFLKVSGDGAARRNSFTDVEIEKIKKACGKVPHAEDIYCMIYTGFRPSEFLSLTADSYDKTEQALVGGGKTKAGTDRAVTISPKIKALITQSAASGGLLFSDDGRKWTLKDFTEKAFYPALEQIGIDNPVENGRHKYTPHSCRHTFATLMKRVAGSDKDKLELIGHESGEMLRYYQDVNFGDLRKITDAI